MGSSQRGLYSVFHWRNVFYLMEVNTQKWAIHNEVYIQSSIGETFYI